MSHCHALEVAHGVTSTSKLPGHVKQFRSLLRGFKRILNDVYSNDVRVAFELPKACRYWKWPELWRFLTKYKMNKYEFHGCKIGIEGRNGKPMKKQWIVASNMPTISVVEFSNVMVLMSMMKAVEPT